MVSRVGRYSVVDKLPGDIHRNPSASQSSSPLYGKFCDCKNINSSTALVLLSSWHFEAYTATHVHLALELVTFHTFPVAGREKVSPCNLFLRCFRHNFTKPCFNSYLGSCYLLIRAMPLILKPRIEQFYTPTKQFNGKQNFSALRRSGNPSISFGIWSSFKRAHCPVFLIPVLLGLVVYCDFIAAKNKNRFSGGWQDIVLFTGTFSLLFSIRLISNCKV